MPYTEEEVATQEWRIRRAKDGIEEQEAKMKLQKIKKGELRPM